jgi:hypothetical protein
MGRQRSRDEWQREVEAWRASGASAAVYAKHRGYSASSLIRWSERAQKQGFVRVEVVPSAGRRPTGLVVTVGGVEVRVEPGFDAELLRTVVDALAARGSE